MSIVNYPASPTGSLLGRIPSARPTGVGGASIYDSIVNYANRFSQSFVGGFNVLDYGADPTFAADSTAAFNAALAAAYAAGGGIVFVPSGRYKLWGTFDASTNSILTVPQTFLGDASGIIRTVGLIGQAMGATRDNGTGTQAVYVGGVVLDFTGAPSPSGTRPAAFAVAPFVAQNVTYTPAVWQNTSMWVDNVTMLLPAHCPFDGLQFANSLQAVIGDYVTMFGPWDGSGSGGKPQTPTAGTVGIFMPQGQNNVKVVLGASHAQGFDIGIQAGEGQSFLKTFVDFCNLGVFLPFQQGLITGRVSIGNCPLALKRDPASFSGLSRCVVDMQMDVELAAAGNWWSPASPSGLVDTNNTLHGTIRYHIFDILNAVFGQTITQTGGTSAHLVNIFA